GYEIPADITIIAIEIKEDLVYSNDFTPEVQSRYDEIYDEVEGFIINNDCSIKYCGCSTVRR
ncbi:MAG: hypothetical protein ABFS35_19850, partial [Bacteroidota bacterium]